MSESELLYELVSHSLKVAAEMGEQWRLAHPEFMDALDEAAERVGK